jgi:plasmid stabilization system protein ParE
MAYKDYSRWYAVCGIVAMPRGSKAKYTDKQKRQAQHIEESYEKKGAPKRLAEQRAWQTVNKQSGGGEKRGGGSQASPAAKRAARKESGQRAARSRKIGSARVQSHPTRYKASGR